LFHSAIVDKIQGLIDTPQFVLRRSAFSRLQLAQTNESQCRTIGDMAMTLTQHAWSHSGHFTQPNEGRLMISPLSVCLSARLYSPYVTIGRAQRINKSEKILLLLGIIFLLLFHFFYPMTCSGVVGPLAAQGGGQICRPFVLGFWNWRACLKHTSDDR